MPIDGSNEDNFYISVSQLNTLAKDLLEGQFPTLWIAGEISNLSKPASGHVYFSLKDEQSSVRAVIFKGYALRHGRSLQEGKKIILKCKPSLYAARGEFQIIGEDVKLMGVGEQELLLRQLKEKLKAKGYFSQERKRAIPPFPTRIGLVTSATGSAVRDMLEVLGKRWPMAEIWISPARVQGDSAPSEISSAIKLLNRASLLENSKIDVMVVGRGGGSSEDLCAFNSEIVADALYESLIPTVSAVGHEDDFTIADLIADLRAVTPTEAATKISPNQSEITDHLKASAEYMHQAASLKIQKFQQHLKLLATRRCLQKPLDYLNQKSQRFDDTIEKFNRSSNAFIRQKTEKIAFFIEKLQALSPLNILTRGYSITMKEKEFKSEKATVILSSELLSPGDLICTRLHNGTVISEVKKIEN
jgi:exodeoxyribonuclease VII large subunit